MHRINAEIWKFPLPQKGYFSTNMVEEFIIDYIKEGVLLPGQRLPAYRRLAKLNGFSRTSMQRIYKRLEAVGWLEAVTGSCTFVSQNFPGHEQVYPVTRAVARLPVSLGHNQDLKATGKPYLNDFTAIGLDTPGPHYAAGWLQFINNQKYMRVFEHFSQCERIKAIKGSSYHAAVLDYLNIRRRFLINSASLEIVIGRMECLQQLFQLILKPGDVMVNTAPRDKHLVEVLETHKFLDKRVIRMDNNFLENLEHLLKQTKIKAIYVRPQCSYPESYTLDADACTGLLALAKLHGFYIIEEDDYHEFWHELKPFKPLICHDHNGHVIYCGALSKISAYLEQTRTIVAAEELIALLRRKSIVHSSLKDVLTERVLTDLLISNKIWEASKKAGREKQTHLFEAWFYLENCLGKLARISKPKCGLSIWLSFADEETLTASIAYLEQTGVTIPYDPNTPQSVQGKKYVRFGFGTWDIQQIDSPAKALLEKFGSVCQGVYL